MTSGIDILSHRNPTKGVWARLAGDMIDGALLGAAAKKTQKPQRFGGIAAAVLGIVVLDLIAAKRLSLS